MFELYQVRYFLAVVETGSFTHAARRVRVSQPTLSAGIQKLEAALGAQLFDRSTRRVALTAAGTRFVEHARPIMASVERAEADLSEAAAPEVVRVGVLVTIPAATVGRLVRGYSRVQGNSVVALFEGTEQELENRLKSGRLDAALTIARAEHGTRARVLFEESYSLALSSEHPLAGRSHISVDELAQESTIVRRRCEVLSETSRFFTDHNVRPRIAYRTEHDERALALVGAGLGVTVMPDSYRAPDVRRAALTGFDYRRRVAIVVPRGAGAADRVERFLQAATTLGWR